MSGSTSATFLAGVFIVLTALSAASAFGAPSGPIAWLEKPQISPPKLSIINAQGKLDPVVWPSQVIPSLNQGSPFLRVWILPPSGISGRTPPPQDYPVSPFPGGSASAVALDLTSVETRSTLPLLRAEKTGQKFEMGLLVSLDQNHPTYFVHPACNTLGVKINTVKEGGQYLYAAAYCSIASGGRVQVRLFHSKEAQWTRLPAQGVQKLKDDSVVFYLDTQAPGSLLYLQGKSAKEPSEIRASYIAVSNKRAGVTVGMGVTEMNYLEPGLGVHLLETGLVGKISGYYLIRPGLFDAGANAFMTLLPIFSSAGSNPSARFYGANMRLGWQLPFQPRGLILNLSAGFYLWGMLVPDAAYGIQRLSGPQIFILARGTLRDGRGYSTYFKFAPISDGFSPSFSNREIALGGTYPLSRAAAARPLALTLDLADAAFTSDDNLNQMRLTSASLGLQMSF